ncbi:MAG: Hsp20/alpha crystallin family protein [Candidatus Nanopelagicales bacterium]|nr:Hsp20/alpha crystallin family protein [Candidatus Nanopelagicales bacterium]
MANRFDPFRDLDRLAERMFSQAVDFGQAMRAMPMDLYREGDHWMLVCDLPGIDPASIDIDVDGRVLTIRAERGEGPQDVEWLVNERVTGTFTRQVTLGDGVDLEHITAAFADGVLRLTLPVAEAAKPRKIAVSAGGGEPMSITKGEVA